MKNTFLTPTLKALSLLTFVFIALVSISTGLSFLCQGAALWIYASCSFTVCLLFLLYLGYGYGRLALSGIRKIRQTSSLRVAFKTNSVFRMVVFSGLGALANFAMGIFYLVLAYIYRTGLDGLISWMFLFAFYARIYLLSLGLSPTPRKENKGLIFATLVTLMIGFLLLGTTIYVFEGAGSFAKQNYIAIADAAYAFIKLTSSLVSLHSARKRKSSLSLAYALIALSLSLYTMFALQATLLDTFSDSADNAHAFAYFGYVASAIIVVAGIVTLVLTLQKRKTLPDGSESAESDDRHN
jgi:hypothetical protein